MAVNVIYISTNQFTIDGDLEENFPPGRALLAYHTNSGAKLVYVDYSDYSPSTGITTVNTLQTESENLSSDLTSIDYSCIKPDTGAYGNVPNELLWMFRGLKKFMYLSYLNTWQVTIQNGYVHVHDGTKDKILWLPGSTTLTPTVNYSINTWYYVYVVPPTNGSLILTSSNFNISSTVPTLDRLKCGYYDASGNRCIGFFYAYSDSTIVWFYMNNTCFYHTHNTHEEPSPNGVYSPTINAPLGDMLVNFCTAFGDTNTAAVTGQFKETEDPDDSVYVVNKISTYSERMNTSFMIFTNSSKQITLKTSATQWFKYSTQCFFLPYGMSGQF